MIGIGFKYDTEKWFMDWLMAQDFEKDIRDIQEARKKMAENPDWERPVVMYGVRRTHHKCIKKQEIAVVVDGTPWQKRARTAETHWYTIVYKRPATDIEWEEVKGNRRRYKVFHYFLEKGWTIDKAIYNITQDDKQCYNIDTSVIQEIIQSFEKFYKRPILQNCMYRDVQLRIEWGSVLES